ncbi:hypothetical protein [Mesorhizobium sp. W016]
MGLLVSSCDTPESLVAEEVLGEMAPLVHVEVAGDGLFSVGFEE